MAYNLPEKKLLTQIKLVMKGGSIKGLQELIGGHKDIKTTMCHAHLSQEHKKKEINRVVRLISLKNGIAANKDGNCHQIVRS